MKIAAAGVVVLLSVMTAAVIVIARKQLEPAASYEYAVFSVPDSKLEIGLNKIGSEGWEIVSARRAIDSDSKTANYEMILKRRVSAAAPRSNVRAVMALLARAEQEEQHKAAMRGDFFGYEDIRARKVYPDGSGDYHRAHCPYTHDMRSAMTVAEAEQRNLHPCDTCKPNITERSKFD